MSKNIRKNSGHYRPIRKISGSPGFSIIEVLIAMAIFSIGFFSIAGLLSKTISSNASAKRSLLGMNMATDVLENLLTKDFEHHPDLADTGDDWRTPAADADGIDNDFDGQVDEQGENNQRAKVRWKVQADIPQPHCKTITVEVRWRDGRKERIYSLSEVRSVLF